MRRHVIVGEYGASDRFAIPVVPDEIVSRLNLIGPGGELNFGIARAVHDLARMGAFPSEIGVDVLALAAHVQFADHHISRSTESQDSWTREIKLVVPVSDVERWNAASTHLIRALNFLTGDLWRIEFRSRPTDRHMLVTPGTPLLTGIPFNRLTLFSGGLDSLIGAINILESGGAPLLISHAGEGATSRAQNDCFNALKNQYTQRDINRLRVWMSFPGLRIDGSKKDKTTRGRSFLFFAIGILVGTSLPGPFTLQVPENGLIALNVPLDPLRLGSHSTHTTHPFYISRWNDMLRALQIDGRIENPYWNKTKGEMVAECSNRAVLRQLIPLSLSCSSPTKGRWAGHGVQHCGYCVPCLIRRASLKRGLRRIPDPTTYSLQNIFDGIPDNRRARGQQLRSFQYALGRIRRNPGAAKMLIHSPGSLADESLERQIALADVYLRGMGEVESLLRRPGTARNN